MVTVDSQRRFVFITTPTIHPRARACVRRTRRTIPRRYVLFPPSSSSRSVVIDASRSRWHSFRTKRRSIVTRVTQTRALALKTNSIQFQFATDAFDAPRAAADGVRATSMPARTSMSARAGWCGDDRFRGTTSDVDVAENICRFSGRRVGFESFGVRVERAGERWGWRENVRGGDDAVRHRKRPVVFRGD